MKTFPHWRAVGRAMRWARQQEGIERCDLAEDGVVELTWLRNEATDEVTLGGAGTLAYSLTIDLADGRHLEAFHLPAADILRVLAALDLIPAHLAYGEDERFGRCKTCDRSAQWVPPVGPFAGRWCHLDPTRPYHVPEVAA